MKVVRRVYIYLMAYASLVMMLTGAVGLLDLAWRLLFGIPEDSAFVRNQFSLNGAFLVVGLVVWVIHWLLAQRSVSVTNPDAAEERASVLRKLFMYGTLFTAMLQVFFALSNLLREALTDLPNLANQSMQQMLGRSIATMLVYGVAGLYYWWVRSTDNSYTPEVGRPATVRRWYFYLTGFIMLTVTLASLSDLGQFVWRTVTQSSSPRLASTVWLPMPVANDLALILSAGTLWLLHWLALRQMTAASREEQHSTLGKVYLYGMLLQTMVVSLGGIALLLYNLLRMFLGTDPVAGTGESLLTAMGGPLIMAVVYGAFWAYHWYVMRWEESLADYDSHLQANLRRLYYSLVGLVGLALISSGVVNMIRLLFDLWLGGSATTSLSSQAWGDQISFFATAVVVGGPVWLFGWVNLQLRATGAGAVEERQSVVRRVYLYLILLSSGIALLGGAAWLIYQLFRGVTGTLDPDAISQSSWALSTSLAAAILLAYHLWVMLGDQRARPATPAPAPPVEAAAPQALAPGALTNLVLVTSSGPANFDAVLSTMRSQLPVGSEVDLFQAANMTPAELAAWLATRSNPANALAQGEQEDQPAEAALTGV